MQGPITFQLIVKFKKSTTRPKLVPLLRLPLYRKNVPNLPKCTPGEMSLRFASWTISKFSEVVQNFGGINLIMVLQSGFNMNQLNLFRSKFH